MRVNKITVFIFLTTIFTFSGPAFSQEFCNKVASIRSESCSVRIKSSDGHNISHYEFSRWTLINMKKLADASKSPISDVVNSILDRMNNEKVDAVGIFYEPTTPEENKISTLPDCHVYRRQSRGTLDTSAYFYRYGSQNCYADGTALIILYGETIDKFRNQQTNLIYGYIRASYPNAPAELSSVQDTSSELASILNFYKIGVDQINLLSSKLNFDISEIATPAISYTVKSGDSMYEIAKAATGNGQAWRDIWALNPQIVEPSLLNTGEVIMIPPQIDGWVTLEKGMSEEEIAAKYLGDQIYTKWIEGYIDNTVKITGKNSELQIPKVASGQNISPQKIVVLKLRVEN
ncbi:LysM peptidoglycan-binding domain-containing protein [Sneathiella sp.]|uniref:LysM peptidoglycan-binding domain-containing protein n=1 Tax=Sneathiella sp. TaxID=1964365 RepID=UPI003569F77B